MQPRLCLPILCVLQLACGFAHVDRDSSSRPERAIGTGATILMPGQAAPTLGAYSPLPESTSSRSGRTSGQSNGTRRSGNQAQGPPPAPQAASSSGAPPPGAGDGLTMIGGATQETDHEDRVRDTPLGPLTVLFGYPFWIFGKSIHEKADQAVDERLHPREEASPELRRPPTHPSDNAEYHRVREENSRMADQIRRQAALPPRSAGSPPSTQGTIGEELAALERSLAAVHPSPGGPRTAVSGRKAQDRDGDGQTDAWTYGGQEQTRREVLDEDGDGRADRVLYYDAGHRLERSEEDLDDDGLLETITQYREGEIVRRRSDMNGDGVTDSWSFFEQGEIRRHDVDRDGDGFVDFTSLYSAGELVSEEEDRNGDGRPDRITHYRDGEVTERSEDNDFDGEPEIRSFYENGKLKRRELRS